MHALALGISEYCDPALARQLQPYGFAPRGFYFARAKTIGLQGDDTFNRTIDYVISDADGTHVATIHPSERAGFERALRNAYLECNVSLDASRPFSERFRGQFGQYFEHSKISNDFGFVADALKFSRYDVHKVPEASDAPRPNVMARMHEYLLTILSTLQTHGKK